MRLRALVMIVMMLVACDSASAQDHSAPSGAGFWASAGAGGGWTRLSCAICRTDVRGGPALQLSGGATVRRGLLVGVEVDGWTRAEDEIRTLLLSGTLSARIYPQLSRGLFLKGGVGVTRYSLDEGELRTTLPGLLLGAGYDIPLSSGYAVTPSVGLLASSFGSLRSGDGTVADDVSVSVLQLGLSLTRR